MVFAGICLALAGAFTLAWIVDQRAKRRDFETRALILGMEARLMQKLGAKVDAAVKALAVERATPTSLPPPTLQ